MQVRETVAADYELFSFYHTANNCISISQLLAYSASSTIT